MTSNLVVGKKRRNKELQKSYGMTPAKPVTLEGRRIKKGDRVKVLKRKSKKKGYVVIRDDRGNEGEVPAADLVAY